MAERADGMPSSASVEEIVYTQALVALETQELEHQIMCDSKTILGSVNPQMALSRRIRTLPNKRMYRLRTKA